MGILERLKKRLSSADFGAEYVTITTTELSALIAAAEALETLTLDVQDYPAWERPCYALDKARAALELLK